MKKIFTVIVLTLTLGISSIYASPRKSSIMGQIVNTEDYSSVSYARITINTLNNVIIKNVETDANGLFELDEVPFGECTMTISCGGFIRTVLNVSVEDSTTDMGIIEVGQTNNIYSESSVKSENIQSKIVK